MLLLWELTVLFNIYGPRADPEDAERTEFKATFYKILQVFSSCAIPSFVLQMLLTTVLSCIGIPLAPWVMCAYSCINLCMYLFGY